ncbi:uncharacterized protein METZ01_LOCUS234138, partial [marine metagenome]
MTYLVTGGFGCIGSYVIRDLLEGGEQVVVYDLTYDLTIPNMVLNEDQINQIIFVGGDIVDLPNILQTIKKNNIDRIIHLASWQVPACQANPPLALKIVSEGTINIFEAA